MSEENKDALVEDATPEVPIVEEPKVEAPVAEEVAAVEPKPEPKVEEPKVEKKAKVDSAKTDKVAVLSTKNINWQEVGVLKKGVNIVSAKDAEKWVTLNGVTLAKPEDVAKEFNV